MGVISVRFNKDEDKSVLIKKSLYELHENVLDLNEIKSFEAKEKKGKVSFLFAEDILKG